MEAKRLKTHHNSDVLSTHSTESETVCGYERESETPSDSYHPLIPHFAKRRRSPSFISLPEHLRYIIYQYAFSSSSNWNELIRITVERDGPSYQLVTLSKPPTRQHKLRYIRSPALHLPAALLRTNHQIYHEALPVLYSGVAFGFTSNPTSLTFLLDRFSDTVRHSIRYLRLYPAPLYVHNGRLGEQLSWAVLCAEVARLPSLRRVGVVYNRLEDLRLNSIESQRARYGKPLALISAHKEPEFERQDPSAAELDQCRSRFRDITASPAQIAETKHR